MESRKSIIHRKEYTLHNSPTSSSSLRKKIIAQNVASRSSFSENDDDAERMFRRRELSSSTPLSTSNNKRRSLGLGALANIPPIQMTETINQCIKLSAENKINVKNAFSLEMIDFMTYMINKHDDNISNLQVASTQLDVSTKIYGFRVDSVHTDILKIVGGLDKQKDKDIEDAEQDEAVQEGAETNNEMLKKERKKKKKAKHKIFSTVEALKGNIEIVKPTSMMLAEGDSQTSDRLYQAILPNHANSGFYQHMYNDVLVDVVESQPKKDTVRCIIPTIEDFSNLEICPSCSDFEFIGWSVENEPEEAPPTEIEREENDNDNRFQFDLDASVEQDNDPVPEPINYFDIEHDNEENVGFYKTVNRAENIINASAVHRLLQNHETSEYSFLQSSLCLHWAGPSHWKFRNFKKPTSAANVMGACMQAPLKKRKEIKLSYNKNEDVREARFILSNSNKLQAKTAKIEWSAKSLTLPEDVHYDISQAIKLYLSKHLNIKHLNDKDDKAVTDISDNERYDYRNPNDTLDYCPNVENDNYSDSKDDNDDNEPNFQFEDDGLLLSQAFTGENLVTPPKLANKISIAYCLKAKKIDMRQLKQAIWKCLKFNNNTDEMNIRETVEQTQSNAMTESKQFSDVYKMLPKLLSKTNAEALSVPISFISLLHLANEKTLKIQSLPDMSDIIVEGN